MELVERYLQAVRFFLTGKDQADILQELAENLASEIEEREATLGRRLTEAETADILRRHGHPLVVASRYRSTTHLIGPVLLPIYVLALKMGLAVALVATVVGAAIGSLLYGNVVWRVVDAMLTFPNRALMVFAWTTVGFAGLDFALKRVRSVPQWDPRALPKLMRRGRDIPRGRTLFELCLLTIAVVWLLAVPGRPALVLGPAATFVAFTPAWRLPYALILLTAVASGVLQAVNFVRPYWTRARSIARIAIYSASLVIVALLAGADQLFAPITTTAAPAGGNVSQFVSFTNGICSIVLVAAAIANVIEIVRELYRIVRRRHDAVPPGPVAAGAAH